LHVKTTQKYTLYFPCILKAASVNSDDYDPTTGDFSSLSASEKTATEEKGSRRVDIPATVRRPPRAATRRRQQPGDPPGSHRRRHRIRQQVLHEHRREGLAVRLWPPRSRRRSSVRDPVPCFVPRNEPL